MDYNDEMTRKHYNEGCDLLTGEDEEMFDSCQECFRYDICKVFMEMENKNVSISKH